jgi:hypothetical protein
MEGRKLSVDDIPMMSSPPHVRHCTDLIRQSLMCHADMTVEEAATHSNGVNGVKGFGISRTCRNWDEFVSLISKWQEG